MRFGQVSGYTKFRHPEFFLRAPMYIKNKSKSANNLLRLDIASHELMHYLPISIIILADFLNISGIMNHTIYRLLTESYYYHVTLWYMSSDVQRILQI